MKNILILLAFIFTVNIYGQDDKKTDSSFDFKRIQIGINFSPDYNYRTLKDNDTNSVNSIIIDIRNDQEIAKFGYSTGLNVCYNFTKTIGLETGIHYTEKGFQTKKLDIVGNQPDPSLPNNIKFIYNFFYIDIPLKANIMFGRKRISFFSSIGFITNIFIKETSTSILEFSNGRIEKKTQPSTMLHYNKVNISPSISTGIDFKMNDRMNLKIEPIFRYGVFKIINASITDYLWNVGINITYYYKL